MTRVSVVLPTHDRPAELRRAVASVLAQSLTDWELLVVDDGSTPAVTTSEAAWLRDPRVQVLRQDVPLGVAAARNLGIGRAGAAWIAFLDDDDLWAPDKLEVQLRAAERAGAGFVFGSAVKLSPAGEVVAADTAPDPDGLVAQLLRRNVVGGPSTVMVRASLLRTVGGFAPDLAVCADWELWLRIAEAAPAAAVSTPVAAILEHPGSMQRVWVDRIADELAQMRARHRAAQEAHGVTLGKGTTEVWLARMRWKATPSPATALGYVVAAARHAELSAMIHGVAARRLRRWTPARAPEWALQLLRDPTRP